MNKLYFLSAALLLPVVLFADVNVSVRIGDGHDHCEQIEYRDDGDPWFESCESSWPHRVSIEYQWSFHGPDMPSVSSVFSIFDDMGLGMDDKGYYCHPSWQLSSYATFNARS